MEALIWCSAASLLASLPCTSASVSSSSSLLRVSIEDRRADAGLLLLEWSCSSSSSSSSSSCKSQSHSRWLDESIVAFVDYARDANALLGRGPHEPPFENENDAQLQLFVAPRLGRILAARKAIPIGTCAMRAVAFAVVVADRAAAKYCHWCFTQLTKKAFRCGACEFALYCSRDCLEADAVLHDVQCATLRQLRDVATLSPVIDKETLRLVLAVIAMEAFVGNPLALHKLYVPTNTPRHAARDLALDQAVKFLRRNLKKTSTPALGAVTRAHIRETILRIQSNAHPLSLNGSSGVCGVGIFPEAAMTLNHSCSPNVVPSFEPKTRSLRFHAVRDISPMELIEYSYLSDLAVGRARRQETLRDGFGFDCECPRCCRDGETTSRMLEISGSSGEEQEVLTQLITLSAEKDPLAVGGKLRLLETRHSALLQSRSDVLFSIKMLELRSATQTNDWGRVLIVAEMLLCLWESQGLPKWYPTTETLHQQIAVATMRLGNASRAQEAMATVAEIQRVCGFMSSSTVIPH